MKQVFILCMIVVLWSCSIGQKNTDEKIIQNNVVSFEQENEIESQVIVKGFKEKYEFPDYFWVYKYNTDFTYIQRDIGISSRVVLYKNSKWNYMEITLSEDFINNRELFIKSYPNLTIPLVTNDGLVLKWAAWWLIWFSKWDIKYIKYAAENTEWYIGWENAESFEMLSEWLLSKFPPNYTQEYLKIDNISKFRKLK